MLNEVLILVNNGCQSAQEQRISQDLCQFALPKFHPFFDPDYMALCSSLRDSMSHDLQAPAEPLASLLSGHGETKMNTFPEAYATAIVSSASSTCSALPTLYCDVVRIVEPLEQDSFVTVYRNLCWNKFGHTD